MGGDWGGGGGGNKKNNSKWCLLKILPSMPSVKGKLLIPTNTDTNIPSQHIEIEVISCFRLLPDKSIYTGNCPEFERVTNIHNAFPKMLLAKHSKAVCLHCRYSLFLRRFLQLCRCISRRFLCCSSSFFLCVSVVSYLASVLSLFVPHLSLFLVPQEGLAS